MHNLICYQSLSLLISSLLQSRQFDHSGEIQTSNKGIFNLKKQNIDSQFTLIHLAILLLQYTFASTNLLFVV